MTAPYSAKDRIKLGCIHLRTTQAQIAENIGTSRQEIAHVGSGRYKSGRIVEGVARELGVSVEWLVYGRGPAPTWWKTGPEPIAVPRRVTPSVNEGEPLSLVGAVKAGDGNVTPFEQFDSQPFPIPATWKVVRVEGLSAYPVLYPGQFAVVDTDRAQRPPLSSGAANDLHDNIVLVQTDNGLAYLKRFCHAIGAAGDFILASVDAGRSSPFVPPETILVIVPVVGTFYVDPTKPRQKMNHSLTVRPSTPPVPGVAP